MTRPHYLDALHRVGVLSSLARFDPHVAGTPPLGLDLADSDIDVLCHAPDPMEFTRAIWTGFGNYPGFGARQWVSGERPVIANFKAEGWTFELFGSPQSAEEQIAWRHFRVEQRLLSIGGEALCTLVMAERRKGLKTEPAFFAVLNLSGNPYEALLNLGTWSDEALTGLLS
jgi:Domain of unknown function (DUF4269)